jgi:Arc/MetJ-type ribon-helix-helix transcriptional regulator
MKTIQIELPDSIATQVDMLVKEGWFTDESQMILLALAEFIHRYGFVLHERFQLEDIDWALQQRETQPV